MEDDCGGCSIRRKAVSKVTRVYGAVDSERYLQRDVARKRGQCGERDAPIDGGVTRGR